MIYPHVHIMYLLQQGHSFHIIKYNTSVSMIMIYPNQGFIHDLQFADSLGRGELCYKIIIIIIDNTLKRAKHAD